MFAVSKLVGAFLELPGLIILTTSILTGLFWKRIPRLLRILNILFCVTLYALSAPITSNSLIRAVEGRESAAAASGFGNDEKSSRILVLGGGILSGVPGSSGGESQLSRPTLARLYTGYRLYQRTGFAFFLSGGSGIGDSGDVFSEAGLMREVLLSWGVPPEIIEVEQSSRTTRENARFSVEKIPDQVAVVYLVTSALHMPRSLYAFKKEAKRAERKLDFVAFPGDYRSGAREIRWWSFLPSKNNLCASMELIHEILGSIVYRIL